MLEKCRRLYHHWAYLDLQHTCDKEQTYYWLYAEDIGRKNLLTTRYMSLFFMILCTFVVIAAAALRAPSALSLTYVLLAALEVIIFLLTSALQKRPHKHCYDNLLACFCLLHFLAFGAYIGTIQSPDESAAVFLVALLLSQILFSLPPVVTTAFSAIATVGALFMSHAVKSDFFFRIDVLDCTGVFIISLLVGWLVNKMRVEEALARTKVQQLNSELRYMSATDQLTGLPNHRNFQETYYSTFELSQRRQTCLGVIMLDIDQFKAFNDNYGHIEGDKCLSAIGDALRAFINDDVYVCRFGGEEFLALLQPSVCGQANEIADRIRQSIQSLAIPHAYSRVASIVTVSAGVFVGIPESGDLPMLFIDHADRAMYQSKADGGNRLTNFSDIFTVDHTTRVSQENYLRLTNRGREVMRRKVLVVDDVAVNRHILRNILRADYQVLEAENGLAALELLQKMPDSISVVLLDIIMPVMDGYTLLARMRANAMLANIPVIITTGNSDEAAEVKALSLGANDFLAKPYKPAVIRQRMENAVSLRETSAVVNAVEKDGLTGVYSKAFFYSKAEALIQASPKGTYDILYTDIDRFRQINEMFGPRTGDALLKHISELIVESIGGGICGRIGSDRFACLIPHQEAYQHADFEASQVAVNRFPISLDINIRCGIYPVDDLSIPVSAMCDRAMIACDSIKDKHGAFFAYYDDALRQKSLSEQFILDGIKTALTERQFTVYYQPKCRLDTGEIIGAEALVRWLHPEKGLLLPATFIPLFEKNGFITDLDRYVWEAVCRDMQSWMSAGHRVLPVSVNVARADIYHPELASILLDLLKRYDLAPEQLHLEITETAYLEDSAQLIKVLMQLKDHGFVIELDDFGAGYSSLHTLSGLPISLLKLDMRFTQAETDVARNNSILDCILELAERLSLSVIAEGVETEAQANRLRALGCGFAQGYYYCHPIPMEEFAARLP